MDKTQEYGQTEELYERKYVDEKFGYGTINYKMRSNFKIYLEKVVMFLI